MSDDKPTHINITSTNQSGGITAHTVNVGKPPRELKAADQSALLALLNLPTGSKFDIESPMGDNEAIALADAIEKFLQREGYVLGKSQIAMKFGVWPPGVTIYRGATPWLISVGPNQ